MTGTETLRALGWDERLATLLVSEALVPAQCAERLVPGHENCFRQAVDRLSTAKPRPS